MSDSSPTSAPTAAPTAAAAGTIEPTTSTVAPNVAAGGILFVLFILFIAIVGIYCIVKSLMCFGKSGSTAEKILGVIIAFFTGPFYLLYLNYNNGYCEDEMPMYNSPMPSQQMGGRRRK
jgi:hypothetical protein